VDQSKQMDSLCISSLGFLFLDSSSKTPQNTYLIVKSILTFFQISEIILLVALDAGQKMADQSVEIPDDGYL
jgi:hypothetical protein